MKERYEKVSIIVDRRDVARAFLKDPAAVGLPGGLIAEIFIASLVGIPTWLEIAYRKWENRERKSVIELHRTLPIRSGVGSDEFYSLRFLRAAIRKWNMPTCEEYLIFAIHETAASACSERYLYTGYRAYLKFNKLKQDGMLKEKLKGWPLGIYPGA